jgi:hypothetical protein
MDHLWGDYSAALARSAWDCGSYRRKNLLSSQMAAANRELHCDFNQRFPLL